MRALWGPMHGCDDERIAGSKVIPFGQEITEETGKNRKPVRKQQSHPRTDGFLLHGQSLASLKFALHPVGGIGPIASRPGRNLLRFALVGRNLCRMTLSCWEGLCVAGDLGKCNPRAV